MTLPERSGSPAISEGQIWRNKHTDRLAVVLNVRRETRHRPTGLRQALDGRLVMYGDEEYQEDIVHFSPDGAPPGFDDSRHGGWSVGSWLEHWVLDEAEGSRAALAGMEIIGREDAAAPWWRWLKRRRGRRLAEVAEALLDRYGRPELPPMPPDKRPVS